MTLEQRLTELTGAIGNDVKTLLANQGNLSTLSTTAKGSIVSAINEIFGLLGTGGVTINDASTSSTVETYSVTKILSLLNSFRDDLLGGVPATIFDTLKEISDYLVGDQAATNGLITAMASRVSVDTVQAFNDTQKAQGRANLGAYGATEIGNPDTDLLTIYNTAKA